MDNIQLLQMTVNSFSQQVEQIDNEIQNGTLMLESMKNARSSMLASMSVLETRIAELEAEEAAGEEQLELVLDPDDELDVPLGRTCFVADPECESCQ